MTELAYPDVADAQDICERLQLHVRDVGSLASALARPGQVVWGVEAYVGIHRKAAALLDAINRSHPLQDGNKRLSILLVMLFYVLNGYVLTVDPDEGDRYIRQVGGDTHLELEDTAAGLEQRARQV